MEKNEKLKEYIDKNIFPEYEKNESAHDINHIKYVIDRSMKFAEEVHGINIDMAYTIAAYHDIGHHIDAKNHEKVSAEILEHDKGLKKFFEDDQIKIMKEAVEDHRASSDHEPRTIYGKIVSSADRNTDIETSIKRTYSYTKKHSPDCTLDEIIEKSRQHLIEKFGIGGYATSKMYFKDEEYGKYLKNLTELTSNKEKFKKKFIEINNLN